jgi:hypothetical protein
LFINIATAVTTPTEGSSSEALCDLLYVNNSSHNKESLSSKVEAKTSVNNTNAEAKLEMPLQDLLTDTIPVMELTLEEQSNDPVEDSTLLDTTTSLPLGD